MYYIRQVHPDDLDTLLKLAKMVHFINLPADKDIIAEKIARSRASFKAAQTGEKFRSGASDRSAVSNSPIYMFVLADSHTNTCHGTSMVVARMGQPGAPNVSFELKRKEFFSQDLQSGTAHITAKLFLDTSGPSEIGGLILSPSMRRHPERLGKQISLIRFHYIGSRRAKFSDHILAEMMAPVTADGQNVFWEHLGRRFINLTYVEADRFCQKSREFMTSLLPREEIYLTLLPPEARQGIAQVGRDTVPARKMLEDLGFKYTNRIDPFDGGPHLECDTADISIVRDTAPSLFAGTCSASQARRTGFVSVDSEDGGYRALYTAFVETDSGAVKLTREAAEVLRVEPGIPLGVTPLDLGAHADAPAGKPVKRSRKRAATAEA